MIAATTGLFPFIEGYMITDFNKVLVTDHRGFIININIEDYAILNHFQIDRIDNSKLDSQRLSYNTKFIERVEEIICSTGLNKRMDQYCNTPASVD